MPVTSVDSLKTVYTLANLPSLFECVTCNKWNLPATRDPVCYIRVRVYVFVSLKKKKKIVVHFHPRHETSNKMNHPNITLLLLLLLFVKESQYSFENDNARITDFIVFSGQYSSGTINTNARIPNTLLRYGDPGNKRINIRIQVFLSIHAS